MSEAKTTTDHKKIQKWAEERNGRPATVAATQAKNGAGILRIDFEPKDEPELKRISWSDFFKKFDEAKLAFLYQEKMADGRVSRFHKFIDREAA
jgi:hypothetical protein